MLARGLSDRLGQFAREYANWDDLRAVCVTIDIDFAPEYMIEHAVETITSHGGRATIFATHASQCLKRLDTAQFEIAFHPNLAPGSTQGTDLAEIIAALRQSYPTSIGNRFHLLHHNYRDLQTLSRLGVRYDVSSLRFNCPFLLPAWHRDLRMTLLTYSWEDGICENARLPMTLSSIDLESPGLKILNFHAVNMFLNGPNAEARLHFLRETRDLTNCPRELAEPHRCQGDGSGNVLRHLLDEVQRRGCRCIQLREVDAAFRDAIGVDAKA